MRVRRWLTGILVPVVAVLGTLLGSSPAQALPIAPPAPVPVTGIPDPCPARHPWPEDANLVHVRNLMQKDHGIKLVGQWWTEPRYRPMVRIVWETLDALSCTDYLAVTKSKVKPYLTISAGSTGSWAWGDWGLTTPGALTFDFAKWQQALDEHDPGRLVRLVVHEIAHAYNSDRGDEPAYWSSFRRVYLAEGRFSHYGHNDMETYADVVGYYVARCAKDNPFDNQSDKGNRAYYDWARTWIFKGAEFGPAPGTKVNCSRSS